MSVGKKNRKSLGLKIALGIGAIVLLFVVGVLWGGNNGLPAVDSNSNILERAQSGGQITLSSEDVNYLLKLAGTSDYKRGSLTIRGIYVKIDGGKLTIYIPASYKGIAVLLSSSDELVYENKDIKINTLNFKVGMIPIPNSLVFDMLEKINNKHLVINSKEHSIIVDKSLLPIDIKAISLKEQQLIVELPKVDLVQKVDKIIDQESTRLGVTPDANAVGGTSSTTGQKVTKSKNPKKSQASNKGPISGTGQRVISIAQSAAGKYISNPNYNYQGDLMTAKALYDKLSPAEKDRVKAAILSRVNTKEVMKVYKSRNKK